MGIAACCQLGASSRDREKGLCGEVRCESVTQKYVNVRALKRLNSLQSIQFVFGIPYPRGSVYASPGASYQPVSASVSACALHLLSKVLPATPSRFQVVVYLNLPGTLIGYFTKSAVLRAFLSGSRPKMARKADDVSSWESLVPQHHSD